MVERSGFHCDRLGSSRVLFGSPSPGAGVPLLLELGAADSPAALDAGMNAADSEEQSTRHSEC